MHAHQSLVHYTAAQMRDPRRTDYCQRQPKVNSSPVVIQRTRLVDRSKMSALLIMTMTAVQLFRYLEPKAH